MRIAVVISHPIHYYAPVFKILAEKANLKVFYTAGCQPMHDPGFRHTTHWSPELLEGYEHEFLCNTATRNECIRFFRIRNPKAFSRIDDFEPNELLIYGWSYYSHLRIMRHYKGKVRVNFRGDSNLLDKQSSFKGFIKKTILRWIYKKVDQVFYTGQNNLLYFKACGLKQHQLFFAPHAVNNQRFSGGQQLLRKQLGIQPEKILLLFTGKLTQNKNPKLLLDAFLEINPANACLLFVGSGPLERQLKTRAGEHRQSIVYFMPFQKPSEMQAIYQACDLFCMPSNHETWGLATNEAMASGKAILVSDHVGCAADLVSKDNGMTFRRYDKNDLKQKLKFLISDKLALDKKGFASKEKIADWTFESQVTLIMHALL